ncbi:MAG: hypothetical protein R3350_03160 [Saprospiraceae bacterium]|nr:hypothetical protein [Saprospiraceae bacterium]
MVTISEVVQQLVEERPFLSEALGEGLINVSALARQLAPEVEGKLGKPVKHGAVVMAIKRFREGALTYTIKELNRFFEKLSNLSVRSGLLDYTFANSDRLVHCCSELLEEMQRRPRAFCTFSQGISETTVIVDESTENRVELLFGAERLLEKESELSAVTLLLPAENRQLYGVYYYILRRLAWHGINLVELISTSNEFTVIVSDEDLDRTFSVLNGLRGM